MDQLPAVPDELEKMVLANERSTKTAIAKMRDTDVLKEAIAQVDGVATWAKRIKATTETMNSLGYQKLLVCGRYGQVIGRKPGKRTDLQPPSPDEGGGFAAATLAAYRKIGDHYDKVDEYYELTKADVADGEDADVTIDGFIHFCTGGVLANRMTREVEWYTPELYIDAARKVMGSIDIDPASCKIAQKTVKAEQYFTAADSGLEYEWPGTVWLNPPYKMPLVQDFVFHLCDEVAANRTTQAILLTNNATDPRWWQRAATEAAAICFPGHRIAFYNKDGESSSPTNGQCFFYFGRRTMSFAKTFGEFGWVGAKT
jgi:ParB family chromosome partitioning protein